MDQYAPPSLRRPYYCSGCPHNTSTKVPEGSFGMVGIGCHYMVQWMDRNSALCTQMGGEGVPWVGSSPFTNTKHIFANLGDGTYFHSGSLAIRASVAAKVNITYKILYNDAVAMTGGQHVDGDMPVWRVAQQVMAEGVAKCWVVSEQPEVYADRKGLPNGVDVLHRDMLMKVQHEAREIPGTTVIIYDQTCAAEKRRRRKRGQYPDPAKRVVINSAVCEGCGDCSVQSNCVSVMPLETEYGRKRQINQTACNKDFSCIKGFCPSFVTIEGGRLRKTEAGVTSSLEGGAKGCATSSALSIHQNSNEVPPDKTVAVQEGPFAGLPEPAVPAMNHAYNIMVTGIGGTGVLTTGALMGMAAHLEGKYCAILDSTGLAQKGGEVLSHVRLAPDLSELRTGHIIAGGTDLLLACDIVSAAGRAAHETLNAERSRAVVNLDLTPVAAFVTNNKVDFHQDELKENLEKYTRKDAQYFIDANMYTATLLGDEMPTNIFMMGYAWQKGLLPLSRESIERAIELNGVAIEENKRAFNYGRLGAHDLEKLDSMIRDIVGGAAPEALSRTLDEVIEKRVAYLKSYQNRAYAKRYQKAVERFNAFPDLKDVVARNYHKLLAYKDEYEVARLYANGDFMKTVKAQFDGDYTLKFHMAPPIFERIDPATGRPKKRNFGPWMMTALSILRHFKFLRGTPLDPFGHLKDRREERELIADYEKDMELVLSRVNDDNMALCAEILSL
ncbi:MAG TPA: indolepyruvate ferredoxin oxidoreductase family protein, partial [Alphaproteobacteria bacterium]